MQRRGTRTALAASLLRPLALLELVAIAAVSVAEPLA